MEQTKSKLPKESRWSQLDGQRPGLVWFGLVGFKHVINLIWGALCPSKPGLLNKHIVKHIVTIRFYVYGTIS